jgi:hypothetical protein
MIAGHPCHPGQMQWHWGNIGSALAGITTAISAAIITITALIRGPAALRDWRARQQAETQAAHERAEAAREEAETTRLERRRGLSGWSAHGTETYGVTLVTETDELSQAATELTSGQPTAYAVPRVTGSTDSGSANLALSLRQLIQTESAVAAGRHQAVAGAIQVPAASRLST